MIILRICGLLAMLVSIVPAIPIMGDVDTTVSPLLNDMSSVPPIQELTTVIESAIFDPNPTTKEIDTKPTPSTSNEEMASSPPLLDSTTRITETTMHKDMPNSVTSSIAGMMDSFEATTTTSMEIGNIIDSSTIAPNLLSTTTSPTSAPTMLAPQPTTVQAVTTTLAIESTTITASNKTNTHELLLENDLIKQSEGTVSALLYEKTMTPPVTEIKHDTSDPTKSPIPVNNGDNFDNLATLLALSKDENSIIEPHPEAVGEAIVNLSTLLTTPGKVDENSHDEVDNVLTLSSNEDTTRIASSTDSKIESNKNNHIVPLSAETEPPKLLETKNDDNGKSFASTISSSFIILVVSMIVVYVII